MSDHKHWKGPYMRIDADPGTKVFYHGTFDEQVRWGGSDDPRKAKLRICVPYTVRSTEIHSWHTTVCLEGIAGAFPAGAFHEAKGTTP